MFAGTAIFGKVLKTEAGAYIGTQFVHVLLFPVVPLDSYIVIESDFLTFTGIKIEPNRLSRRMAYLRAIMGLMIFVMLVCILALYIISNKINNIKIIPLILILSFVFIGFCSIFGLSITYFNKKITRANSQDEKWINEKIADSRRPNNALNSDAAARNEIHF